MTKLMINTVPQESWSDREARWQRRLRRLRLGAEPIDEQLERLRLVTIALTAVGVAIGLIFLSIFAAFGRADIGGMVVGILLVPVITLAWLDHAILRLRASAYLRDRENWEPKSTSPA